jgi:hypothetical protein
MVDHDHDKIERYKLESDIDLTNESDTEDNQLSYKTCICRIRN